MTEHKGFAVGFNNKKNKIVVAAKTKEELHDWLRMALTNAHKYDFSEIEKNIGSCQFWMTDPEQKNYKNFMNLITKENNEEQ